MEKNEIVEFNGKRYYHYGQKGYYASPYDKRNKKSGTRLHRDVWEFYSGQKIPQGYQIHHIDGNRFNNDFNNLECISISEHRKKHYNDNVKIWKREDMQKASQIGRERCKEWHASEEGRKWHSKHQKEYIKKLQVKEVCQECGVEFGTFNDHRHQIYCRKCRDKFLKRELRKKSKKKSI